MLRFLKLFRRSSRSGRTLAHRNSSFRPSLELLEDRRVPTASGNITAVLDNSGHYDYYAIGMDHTVYQHLPSGWHHLSGQAGLAFSEITAGLDKAGDAELFGLGTTNNVVYRYNFTAGDWVSLGGHATQISASLHGTAEGTVFAIGRNERVFEWNSSTRWANLGGTASEISAGDNFSTPVVFAIGSSSQHVFVNQGSGWTDLGGDAIHISAAQDSTGGAEVFAIMLDVNSHQAVYVRTLSSTWTDLNGNTPAISSGYNPSGGDVIYAIGSATNHVYVNKGSHWVNLGGQVIEIAGVSGDVVFVVTPKHTAWVHDAHGWHDFGGDVI